MLITARQGSSMAPPGTTCSLDELDASCPSPTLVIRPRQARVCFPSRSRQCGWERISGGVATVPAGTRHNDLIVSARALRLAERFDRRMACVPHSIDFRLPPPYIRATPLLGEHAWLARAPRPLTVPVSVSHE